MEINYEIERKFLVSFPDTDRLNVRKKISIIQTYLNDGENGEQRRVRKMDVNGTVSYTYTEKVFVSAVTREENERSIDCDEYNLLVKQAKVDLKPVIKTRFVFEYRNQFFEEMGFDALSSKKGIEDALKLGYVEHKYDYINFSVHFEC